jgi:hypothetical protein
LTRTAPSRSIALAGAPRIVEENVVKPGQHVRAPRGKVLAPAIRGRASGRTSPCEIALVPMNACGTTPPNRCASAEMPSWRAVSSP